MNVVKFERRVLRVSESIGKKEEKNFLFSASTKKMEQEKEVKRELSKKLNRKQNMYTARSPINFRSLPLIDFERKRKYSFCVVCVCCCFSREEV